MLLVTLITLGSGLVNLYSLFGPSLPARIHVLRSILPLEFLTLSRFLTLLLGFALVISSLNIYKQKKRAFRTVLALGTLSAVFHLTKGVDYEEALFSIVLVALLLMARRHFTVRSGAPDWRSALVRLGLSGVIVVGYGVLGFWLLDRRDFGIDFTLSDAIRRTVLLLSLAGDGGLIPRTHYAAWFLESLSVLTVAGVAYSATMLFRPVIYRFRTLPQERAQAHSILASNGRSSLDYFKIWPDKSFFFSESRRSFIAYRVGFGFALALADPVGPEEEIERLMSDFAGFCGENDWRVAFYQTLPDFLPAYQRCGFKKLNIGDDAIVDLATFSLAGKKMKSLRDAVNKSERAGITVRWCEPPIPDEVLAQLRHVSDQWLQIPGRRERTFTLGRFDEDYVRTTPVFFAADSHGRVPGFVNIIPSYRQGEATIDLMRRTRDAPNGITDFLLVKLLQELKARGFGRFNLGMAPMTGLLEEADASTEARAIHVFFQHLNFIFSFKGLRAFKAKYATAWEPRYLMYRHVIDLPRIGFALARVSEIRD